MQFFPHRTDAHIRISEGYLVTAGFAAHAFNKMDFIINTEFNLAKVHFTRQTGKVFFASGGLF
jgi:hypothetical protein